ncbi:MAG: hypothetical protein ACOCUL_05145 [Bacteroidota bacterium]
MKNLTIIFLFFLVVFVVSCQKEKELAENASQELIFDTLIVEQDTINVGNPVELEAVASGYLLEYQWPVTSGNVVGSGPGGGLYCTCLRKWG